MSQKTENLLNRVWRCFYTTVIGDCLFIPFFYQCSQPYIFIVCIAATVFIFVLFLYLFYNYWSFIPAKDGWIGSTSAVLLLLIPVLNLIWYGVMLLKLSSFFDRRTQGGVQRCMPLAILHITLYVAYIWIPHSGLILLPAAAVLLFILLYRFQRVALLLLKRGETPPAGGNIGCLLAVIAVILFFSLLMALSELTHLHRADAASPSPAQNDAIILKQ